MFVESLGQTIPDPVGVKYFLKINSKFDTAHKLFITNKILHLLKQARGSLDFENTTTQNR